jgi:NAD(P)-dependent dehydrogenase (short-subunit alcohol dehydrogenase family)
MVKLQNQVAVITGGGRNIGAETARLFASEGAKVAIADNDKGRGEAIAAEIESSGGSALTVVMDVSSEADIIAMVGAVVKKWGRIDILINNVAISDNKTLFDITKAEWDQTLAVTLTGPFLVSKYVAKQMVGQGQSGKIVNIGSTSGYRGRDKAIAYTSAKGGVLNLTRSLAVFLAPHNIRVNSISPNMVGSPVGKENFDPNRKVRNLKGRPGEPAEVAKIALFLVSDDSEFVMGHDILADGGFMCMM